MKWFGFQPIREIVLGSDNALLLSRQAFKKRSSSVSNAKPKEDDRATGRRTRQRESSFLEKWIGTSYYLLLIDQAEQTVTGIQAVFVITGNEVFARRDDVVPFPQLVVWK